MNSQFRGTKRKHCEEITQNTVQGSCLDKEAKAGGGETSYCETLLDRFEGIRII